MSKKISLDPKKTRQDKKINVNPAIDQDTHAKLFKLAVSCNQTKTKMAELIIKMAVNNPSIIDFFQKQYNTDDHFRIVPIQKDGKIFY